MQRTVMVIDKCLQENNNLCVVLQDPLLCRTILIHDHQEAIDYISAQLDPFPELILLDISNTTEDCNLIFTIKTLTTYCPIIVLVKYGDYESAMLSLNAGAHDFLCKPAAIERISTTLHNTFLFRDAMQVADGLRSKTNSPYPFSSYSKSEPPFSFLGQNGMIRRMEEIEAEAIRFAMQYYDGHMTEVARRLGIGRSTLYRKLNELGIRDTMAEA